MEPDLLFLDTPVYRFALDALRPRRTLFRLADYTPGFGHTHAFIDVEREVVSRADLVMVSALPLIDYARSLGATRVMYVANGVDYRAFSAPVPPHPALEAIRRPRAIYVGTMREWFDFGLIERLVTTHPSLSVVLVGPDDAARRRLSSAPNLHILGARDHEEVPSLLQSCDVGLIPFDVANHGDLVETVDPLKLHEYLAAGLPVVATAWSTLESLGSPALLAHDDGEFLRLVDDAIARRAELGMLGPPFAATADWAHRFDGVLAELGLGPE